MRICVARWRCLPPKAHLVLARGPLGVGGANPTLGSHAGDGVHTSMSDRLVGLDEILVVVRDRGPLSSHAVARTLQLYELDARLALLRAAGLGLTRRDERGDWSLTTRGRESLIRRPRAIGVVNPVRALSRRFGAMLVACLLAGIATMAAAGSRARLPAGHRAAAHPSGPARPGRPAPGAVSRGRVRSKVTKSRAIRGPHGCVVLSGRAQS
jgi:hypothetical protein